MFYSVLNITTTQGLQHVGNVEFNISILVAVPLNLDNI